MKTSFGAIIAEIGMLSCVALSAPANASTTSLAWQESGHPMDVVIATARRPKASTENDHAAAAHGPGLTAHADVVISTDGELELREQAAAAVRAALTAERITLESLSVAGEDRERVL